MCIYTYIYADVCFVFKVRHIVEMFLGTRLNTFVIPVV